jgi:hypothetical protein
LPVPLGTLRLLLLKKRKKKKRPKLSINKMPKVISNNYKLKLQIPNQRKNRLPKNWPKKRKARLI